MKFFLDTANIDEIKRINDLGLCDGVTTNPSIIKKKEETLKKLLQKFVSLQMDLYQQKLQDMTMKKWTNKQEIFRNRLKILQLKFQ